MLELDYCSHSNTCLAPNSIYLSELLQSNNEHFWSQEALEEGQNSGKQSTWTMKDNTKLMAFLVSILSRFSFCAVNKEIEV